ncbi:MAG: hypothetical protein GX568_05025 [Candidatus Gastranaerophilales bacterium]|nr:hypothetical protein [Candidatus Gastranaerophilales bacterium]
MNKKSEPTNQSKEKSKKIGDILTCPVCGNSCNMLYITDFQYYSGRAGWHMDFEPKQKMCQQCSDSLLDYLHKWFTQNNKTNEYKKFKL